MAGVVKYAPFYAKNKYRGEMCYGDEFFRVL